MSDKCHYGVNGTCSDCERIDLHCHPSYIATRIQSVSSTSEYQELKRNFIDFAKYVLDTVKIGNEEIALRAIKELRKLGVRTE